MSGGLIGRITLGDTKCDTKTGYELRTCPFELTLKIRWGRCALRDSPATLTRANAQPLLPRSHSPFPLPPTPSLEPPQKSPRESQVASINNKTFRGSKFSEFLYVGPPQLRSIGLTDTLRRAVRSSSDEHFRSAGPTDPLGKAVTLDPLKQVMALRYPPALR